MTQSASDGSAYSGEHGLPASEDRGGILSVAADAARKQGRFAEAEDLYLQAIACREQLFGAGNRKLVPLLDELAQLYADTDRFGESEETFYRALEILQKFPQESKVRDIEVLTHFSLMLRKSGRDAEAEHMEACCRSAIREEEEVPLLLKVARGLAPSTGVDVKEFGMWLDQTAAQHGRSDSTGNSTIKSLTTSVSPHAISRKPGSRYRFAFLVLLVVAWCIWFFYVVLYKG